jgi:hypothetical protein
MDAAYGSPCPSFHSWLDLTLQDKEKQVVAAAERVARRDYDVAVSAAVRANIKDCNAQLDIAVGAANRDFNARMAMAVEAAKTEYNARVTAATLQSAARMAAVEAMTGVDDTTEACSFWAKVRAWNIANDLVI